MGWGGRERISCGGLVFLVHAAREDPDRIVGNNGRYSAFASSHGAHPLAWESLPSSNILV
jgi:hypothetical protein